MFILKCWPLSFCTEQELPLYHLKDKWVAFLPLTYEGTLLHQVMMDSHHKMADQRFEKVRMLVLQGQCQESVFKRDSFGLYPLHWAVLCDDVTTVTFVIHTMFKVLGMSRKTPSGETERTPTETAERTPAETERTPTETAERTPADTERTPTETAERTPAETKRTPTTSTERTPAETERTPTTSTARTPAETERTPRGNALTPEETKRTAAKAERKSEETEKTPAENGERTSNEIKLTPAEARTPEDTERTPAEHVKKTEDETPEETEMTPAETERTPTETTETETTPAETERTSAETERTPTETTQTERTSEETEKTPAETETTSGESERTSVEAERTPAETERTSEETERTPGESERPPPEVGETPARFGGTPVTESTLAEILQTAFEINLRVVGDSDDLYDVLANALSLVDVSVKDFHLLEAVFTNDPCMVKRLLADGCMVHSNHPRPFDPLHYAVLLIHSYDLQSSLEIVALLLNHGADPNRIGHTKLPDVSDFRSGTPLHYTLDQAADDGGFSHWRRQVIQLLLRHGADPSILNNENRPCFHTLGEEMRRQWREMCEAAKSPGPLLSVFYRRL